MQFKDKNFLIVGAGISALTLANLLILNGASKVKIIEKRNHIGGNCYDYKNPEGFMVHQYGPHIFHTNYDEIIKFVQQFSSFDLFEHKVLVKYHNDFIPLPINETSLAYFDSKHQPEEILNTLKNYFKNAKAVTINQLLNAQDKYIQILGQEIYHSIYENYTMKMWNIKANEVDLNVLSRVKILLNNDWNYFPNDKFVGIPKNGWTFMLQNMVQNKRIQIQTLMDFKEQYSLDSLNTLLKNGVYDAIFFSGMIDELFNYRYGHLPYRSLNFQFEYLKDVNDFQPTSVVNYPELKYDFTRITEYKKLCLTPNAKGTLLGKEYPGEYNPNDSKFALACYPISNLTNLKLYNQYYETLKKFPNLYAIGRLGMYRYMDTDDSMYAVFELIKQLNPDAIFFKNQADPKQEC